MMMKSVLFLVDISSQIIIILLIFSYLGTKSFGSQATKHELYQSVNLDNAKVTGFELKTKFTLGKWISWLKNVDFGYQLTKQKVKQAITAHLMLFSQ